MFNATESDPEHLSIGFCRLHSRRPRMQTISIGTTNDSRRPQVRIATLAVQATSIPVVEARVDIIQRI